MNYFIVFEMKCFVSSTFQNKQNRRKCLQVTRYCSGCVYWAVYEWKWILFEM